MLTILFVGSIITKTVAYFQNRLGQSSRSRSKIRKLSLHRNREVGYNHLIENYFADDIVYSKKFQRRFQMRKQLLLCIVDDLEDRFSYFQWKWDARRRKGFSPIQNFIAAIHQLAYDMCTDKWDEYLRMSHHTTWESQYKFTRIISLVYGQQYLHKPTINDVHQLYTVHESKHWFPGLLVSIDFLCAPTHVVVNKCEATIESQQLI